MNKAIMIFAVLALGSVPPAYADDERAPLQIELKAPQRPVAAKTDLTAVSHERYIALVVEDNRGDDAGAFIGQATNDQVVQYPILAVNDVRQYVNAVAQQVVTSWGLKTNEATDGKMTIHLVSFNVNARSHAIGATYVGEVTLNYVLSNRAGKPIATGSFSGSADHYGRGRSALNCNEALRDAIEDALKKVLNDPGFRKIWMEEPSAAASSAASAPVKLSGKPAVAPAAPSSAPKSPAMVAKEISMRSIQNRLHRLDELYKNGDITRGEYDKQRAVILDDI